MAALGDAGKRLGGGGGRRRGVLPYFGQRRTLNLRYYDGRGPALAARIRALLERDPLYITSERLKADPDFPHAVALRTAGHHKGVTLYEVTSVAQSEKGKTKGRMKKKLSTAPRTKKGPNGMGSER